MSDQAEGVAASMRVVAIDGPVGSGKSSVARVLAERLGMECLETGAMYRAVALAAIRSGVDPCAPGADLARVAAALDLTMGTKVELWGIDVTEDLRDPEVTRVASLVAADRGVRLELVRRQRTWAAVRFGGVVEGRDIGSVVFPDAILKVFLTASQEERQARRQADEDPGDLARRDQADTARTESPLVVADDAVVVDTTGRSIADIVEEILVALRAAETPGSAERIEAKSLAASSASSASNDSQVAQDLTVADGSAAEIAAVTPEAIPEAIPEAGVQS